MEVPSESFCRSSWDSRTCYPWRATNQGLTIDWLPDNGSSWIPDSFTSWQLVNHSCISDWQTVKCKESKGELPRSKDKVLCSTRQSGTFLLSFHRLIYTRPVRKKDRKSNDCKVCDNSFVQEVSIWPAFLSLFFLPALYSLPPCPGLLTLFHHAV